MLSYVWLLLPFVIGAGYGWHNAGASQPRWRRSLWHCVGAIVLGAALVGLGMAMTMSSRNDAFIFVAGMFAPILSLYAVAFGVSAIVEVVCRRTAATR